MTFHADARYRAAGFDVALRIDGWVQRWEPAIVLCLDAESGEEYEEELPHEGEWVDDREGGVVYAVMVGDDHRWRVELTNLVEIDDEDYCHECGSTRCTANAQPRSQG